FDLDYGWGFRWDNAAEIRKRWEKMRNERPRGGARFIRFIDNHDIANDDWHNRIEKAWGSERVDATLVALFTLDGVPFLYNGQEVADTARHSIFGRSPIDWANGDTAAGKARFAFCKKLCAMRHAERTLTHGALTWLDNDAPDAVLSYLRTLGDEQILTVVNLTGQQVSVQLVAPRGKRRPLRALLAHGVKEEGVKDGKTVFMLDGNGFFVGKR
ncbi:MAG: alpha-glucosidase C-terminal domain-containing protein, partial [Planctomycetes bacterium]|nr:alpha-glucosidase C-terminal domain-containing protein [Planctomycetota bacterium]